jgi:hypothetical protein
MAKLALPELLVDRRQYSPFARNAICECWRVLCVIALFGGDGQSIRWRQAADEPADRTSAAPRSILR